MPVPISAFNFELMSMLHTAQSMLSILALGKRIVLVAPCKAVWRGGGRIPRIGLSTGAAHLWGSPCKPTFNMNAITLSQSF